jgi:outer membrane lipoprotein
MMRMMKIRQGLLLLLTALLLSACATGPRYPTEGVELALTPQQAIAEADILRGKSVLWGGMIINSINLASHTRLEILAYPLDSNQHPQTDSAPLGRFLLFKSGYLETVDFAPGRLVTVRGQLDGATSGIVGETSYTYPQVRTGDLYLWPRAGRSESRVHFGVGVIFGN